MARIKNKTRDTVITNADYLLGTDADQLYATKSYLIGDLAAYFVSYLSTLPEVGYEGFTNSGLKAAGNLIASIGDYSDSANGTKVTVDDNASTILLNSTTYTRTLSKIQIGGTADFFATINSDSLSADVTLTVPDTSGTIAISINGVASDADGDLTVGASSDIASGIIELATIAEVDTGTDALRAITPAGLAGSALQTKVDGIEALADVTDVTNVTAAGATMDTDTSLAGNGYFLDEDDMVSDSASKTVSQQSVKKFVENSTLLGQKYATVLKTGNYTVTTDDHTVIATANSFTVALIAAATAGIGKRYEIKNSESNVGTITVDGDVSETIEGALTQTLFTGESITVVCDGSNWHIV